MLVGGILLTHLQNLPCNVHKVVEIEDSRCHSFLRVVASVQDKMLVGGILLTHLQNLPCNAHEVAEIEIPAASVKDSAQNEIGSFTGFIFSLLDCYEQVFT